MTAADRPPCPVPTCSEPLPFGQIVCMKCWDVLPAYQRTALLMNERRVRGNPTSQNRQRFDLVKRGAIAIATTARAGKHT